MGWVKWALLIASIDVLIIALAIIRNEGTKKSRYTPEELLERLERGAKVRN